VDEGNRRRIEDYVRPLAVGLDGATNYGDVARVVAACEKIAAGREEGLDGDLLFLLAVFSGQERWVTRMGHRSRTEIFLSSLGVPRKTVQALFGGLARFQEKPATPEEEIVHDAVRLEAMGAYGIARLLAEGHRERSDFLEIAGAVEQAAAAILCTKQAELLAQERRRTMGVFARRLREEYEEFAGGTQT
jgi:hypothetical protein